MTREQYIDGVILRLGQLTDKTYRPQYIEHVIDLVWQSMIFNISGKITTDEAFYAKLFESQTVSADGSYYYCDVPNSLIHLDRVGSGVISINQIDAHDFDFVPVSDDMFSLLPSQPMYDISRKIYYKVGYDRILFCDKMTDNIASVGVDIRMVCNFSGYEYTDEIPLPAGQIEGFFDSIVGRITGTPPADLDNKSDK